MNVRSTPRSPRRDRRRQLRVLSAFWLCFPACLLSLPFSAFATGKASARTTTAPTTVPTNHARLQALVDELRARLTLPHEVKVAVVPENPLIVSVRAPANGRGAFHLAFEEGFLETLEPEDLEAVVAHELGHVWIFTHHPFLQTEQLANRIAMRVVSRDSLERVYEKVWQRAGRKGTMARFLE